ncbi:MAG: hypothetical protein K2K25_00855 [Muribaculaceae bacterium]|nr:hypothetical protein [Muribaculaceae bacterium]
MVNSIQDITYDNSGNPVRISFADGGSISNVYSSTGEKLKALSYAVIPKESDPIGSVNSAWDPQAAEASASGGISGALSRSTVECHGPVIYRNGMVDMVLFPGGYATLSGSRVTFHYYTQDYLGNNRAVINGSNGTIEQTVAYYPFGGIIADLGTKPTSGQPYKFGGKELLTANGLNEYDFGSRFYYSAVPHFTKLDPLCEKYYWLSPYLYCINNPVNAIDPDGKDVFLYATTLPGGPDYGEIYRKYGPTHTFITVVKGKTTHYFAFGSEIDGIEGATKGHLKQRFYKQDQEIYSSNGENVNLKVKIKIDPPEGLSSDDFDNAVIEVANSYGDQEGITYHFATSSETTGNCNTSTSTILFKAGVSKENLSKIRSKIPGLDWGFGDIKPWTDTEQINALKNVVESFTRILRYGKLEEALH